MAGPRTLVDVLDDFERRGYVGQFRPLTGGQAECETCEAVFAADRLAVGAYERLEGTSDPEDMMLAVAASCPECESKGTVVLAYGPMASAEDAEVEAQLRLK